MNEIDRNACFHQDYISLELLSEQWGLDDVRVTQKRKKCGGRYCTVNRVTGNSILKWYLVKTWRKWGNELWGCPHLTWYVTQEGIMVEEWIRTLREKTRSLSLQDLSLVLKWPFGTLYKLGNDVSSGQIESPQVHNLAHTVKVAYLSLLSAFATMDDMAWPWRLSCSYLRAAPSFSLLVNAR